jgi:dTDP-glucose pyrophosphorylase
MNKNFLITKNKTLKEAMKLISINMHKCLVVVDKKNQLLGTLSDGDIRSALLKNFNLDDKIKLFFNSNAKFILEKNLSTIKLKELFLNRNLDIIPIINDKKKVVDVTYWSKVFGKNNEIKIKYDNNLDISAVIMAGGEGTRMLPFTKILPKPLIPVNNKPVLEHIMDNFSEQGIKNFFITINHKAEIIKAYFKELNSKRKIFFIKEKTPLGTAGSLKFLQNKIKKSFFVANCDTIINIDFKDLYNFHEQKKNMITIVASAKEKVIPYGVCNLSPDGRLKNIKEKPKSSFLAVSGIYCVNPKILKFVPKNKKFDFPDLISIVLNKKLKVGVFPIDDNSWLDTGQWSEYKKTLEFLEN